jgi:Lipocalin-like domain
LNFVRIAGVTGIRISNICLLDRSERPSPAEIQRENTMNRRSLLAISTATVFGLALMAGNAAAQSAKDLVGSWTIVSVDGYGPNPKGSLIFESNGRYSLQLLRSDLQKYGSNSRTQGTPAEYKATVDGSLSYFGTYSLSGSDLILRVEGSSFPNWIGTDQKRVNVSITGDELKYTNTAPSGGGAALPLVWKRVK